MNMPVPGLLACELDRTLSHTAFEDASHIQTTPDDSTQGSEQSCKGMLPFIFPRNKTEQNICQKSRPYLPAHGVLVVAHEVGELKCLLDLLEENLNGPACK